MGAHVSLYMRAIVLCLLAAGLGQADESPTDKPAYTFGTTVVNSSGLEGRVYQLKEKTERLPKWKNMRSVGTIYTNTLNIWPQRFEEGFAEVTDRFEWFGIDYTGKIWIEKAGEYRFSLLSDDGARLRIGGELVIDNDGVHRASASSASATLTRGVHTIEVEYFQGPRFTVALVLAIAPPGEPWKVLNMDDFKPPKDPQEWAPGKISGIRSAREY
jgi:hypothetical protein